MWHHRTTKWLSLDAVAGCGLVVLLLSSAEASILMPAALGQSQTTECSDIGAGNSSSRRAAPPFSSENPDQSRSQLHSGNASDGLGSMTCHSSNSSNSSSSPLIAKRHGFDLMVSAWGKVAIESSCISRGLRR